MTMIQFRTRTLPNVDQGIFWNIVYEITDGIYKCDIFADHIKMFFTHKNNLTCKDFYCKKLNGVSIVNKKVISFMILLKIRFLLGT